MPDPDLIAQLITDTRLIRERATALATSIGAEPCDRACRMAASRAELFLARAVTALREAHDEATIATFVQTGEVGRLRA